MEVLTPATKEKKNTSKSKCRRNPRAAFNGKNTLRPHTGSMLDKHLKGASQPTGESMRRHLILAGATAGILLQPAAHAQDRPAKTVRIVVSHTVNGPG